MLKRIVSLSGGLASAVAAERVMDRFGKADVVLWFADTSFEDEDLHRFLGECTARWGVPVWQHCDGRNPKQVAEQKQIIPNSLIAPCSEQLKIIPFSALIGSLSEPFAVYLGLDWWEGHRFDKPRASYTALGAREVEFPLAWKPLEFRPYEDVTRSWGIEPPRLYRMGFSHNNCGGRCVRQGIGEWERLLVHFPERFDEMMDWEDVQRSQGGPRANYTICKDRIGGVAKPLTLREIKRRMVARGPNLIELLEPPANEDRIGCMCPAA